MDLATILKVLKDNPEMFDKILPLIMALLEKVLMELIEKVLVKGMNRLVDGVLEEIKK